MNEVQTELKKALDLNQAEFSESPAGWSWKLGDQASERPLPSLGEAVESAAHHFKLYIVVSYHLIEVGTFRCLMIGVHKECLKFIRKNPDNRTLMYPNGRLASYVL